MGLNHSPSISMDDLALCLDAGNPKSYPGSGSTWYDLSGRDNHLTLYNSPVYNQANRGEIRFSNSNDYARINNSSSAALMGNNATIDLWFRTLNGTLQTSGNYARLVSISDAGGTGDNAGSTQGINRDYSNFVCLVRNDYSQTLAVWYKNSSGGPSGFAPSTTINVNTNSYFNVTVAWETVSTTMRFYFYYNGVLQNGPSTFTVTGFTGATTLTLGANCAAALTNTMENADVAISSFKAYTRALSPAAIQQNFNALRGRYGI